MTQHVVFPLEDRETFRIEVDGAERSGTTRAGVGDVVEKASETLDAALARLKPTVSALMGVMREMDPEEVAIEFGFKVCADASRRALHLLPTVLLPAPGKMPICSRHVRRFY